MNDADLDPDAFPYVFECECGEATEITHEDATDAVPPGINATIRQATRRALRSEGWGEVGGEWLCPACVEERAA